MTQRKITYALNKIKSAKKEGYTNEALLRTYQLNIDLLRYMLLASKPQASLKDKKIKQLVKLFLEEISIHPNLKLIIAKKSLKSLKLWVQKMDHYFKALKLAQPLDTNSLLLESSKVFGILNISANKLFVKKQKH